MTGLPTGSKLWRTSQVPRDGIVGPRCNLARSLAPVGSRATLVGCLLIIVCATGCPWGPTGGSTEALFGWHERIGESDGQSSDSGQSVRENGAENEDLPVRSRPGQRFRARQPTAMTNRSPKCSRAPKSRKTPPENGRSGTNAFWLMTPGFAPPTSGMSILMSPFSGGDIRHWKRCLLGLRETAPILAGFVAHEDPIVAANAAIGLSRQGDASATAKLLETIRNPRLELPIRRAAVESLASAKDPSPVALLRDLLDDYATDIDDRQKRPYCSPGVHAELIRGLSWHVRPSDDPRFADALASDDADVRLEALRSWIGDDQSGPLPEAARWLREDRDWRVRAAALTAMAKRRDSGACEYLAAALGDPTLKVRAAAIAGLGELRFGPSQGNPGRSPEGPVGQDSSGGRVGPCRHGSPNNGSGCRQGRVVACPQGRCPGPGQVARPQLGGDAEKLLVDQSCEVQREAVAAVAKWSLDSPGRFCSWPWPARPTLPGERGLSNSRKNGRPHPGFLTMVLSNGEKSFCASWRTVFARNSASSTRDCSLRRSLRN